MANKWIKTLIELPIILASGIFTTEFWQEIIICVIVIVFNSFIYPQITKGMNKKQKQQVDDAIDKVVDTIKDKTGKDKPEK